MARKQGLQLRPKLISIAVASCFVTSTALANPTGPTVVHGTATFQQAANLLKITNSPNAIINWQSFSIGANEITRFIQQSQSSAVLNRVTGNAGVIDPSVILGALQSNGRVFLINPSGILFGAGAQIDVAGLVASSLNLSNADFLANRLKFTDVPGAGSVINQGNITTGSGGNVYLVGPAVTNSGIITSPQGEVVLAAGNSVELVSPGTPNLRVEVNAQDEEARNIGQIIADAGRVGIYAGLVNQSGTIRANGASVTEDGRIVLKATKNATLEAGSVTVANGVNGGSVTVQSGDTTLVAGTIEAKGADGAGGNIEVLGNLVGLTGNASLDASGASGGGTVLVGGDFQGKNPDVQNAFRTYIGADATIRADAATSGDGGKVIVWSDDATRFYGNISARGGAQSGDGGFVEVSGKRWLDYAGLADTRAPNGVTGTLLLDPSNIEINNGVTTTGSFDGDPFFLNGTLPAKIDWLTIKAQLAFSNAIISTSLGAVASEPGDITIAGNSPDLASPNFLRLHADRDIMVNGQILNTGSGNVEMYAGWNGSTVTPGVGTLSVNSAISTRGNIFLNAGGNVTINSAVSTTGVTNSLPWDVSGTSPTVNISSAGGGIVINSSGSVAAKGGDAGIASYGGDVSAYGGSGAVSLNAANGIIVNGSVSATGGNGGSATATADGYASAQGGGSNVYLTANSGGVTGSGSLSAIGGTGGTATAGGVTPADATGGSGYVSVYSYNGGSIALTGSVSVTGGAGGDANGYYASARAGDGSAYFSSDTGNVGLGGVNATGGVGGVASGTGYASADGGEGSISAYASGSLSTNGNIVATGGNAGTANSSDGYAYSYGGSGNVYLQFGAGGVSGSGSLSATGGAGGTATTSDAYSAYADGGQGYVSVYSYNGGSIALTGSVSVTGGAGGNANGYDAYAQAGDGSAYFSSDTGNVGLGGVNATGGVGGVASGTGYAYVDGGEGSVSAYTSGSLSTNGNIVATGRNAGTANAVYGGSAIGGDADITLWSYESGLVVNGNLVALAGNGGSTSISDGGYAYSYGGSGAVYLEANAAGVSGSGSLSATGGAGGTATTSGATYYADASGGQGYVSVYSYNGGSIALTGSVSVTGGAGGNANGYDAYARAGDGSAYFSSDTGNVGLGGVSATGGVGGVASGTVYAYADGGEGFVSAYTSGSLSISGNIVATGGNAGTANGAYDGRAIGGAADISLESYESGLVVNGNLVATGGAGGTATTGGAGAYAYGGYADVLVSSANGVTLNGPVSVVSGNGGTGTATQFVHVYADTGQLVVNTGGPVTIGGAISVTGGTGGSGTASGDGAVVDAIGGFANIQVSSNAGNVTTSGLITATAGQGGAGNVTGTGGSVDARGDDAMIQISSNIGAVTLNNGVSAAGGAGGTASGALSFVVDGGEGSIYVSGGNVTISNSTLTATGGSASSGWGGDAWVDIYAHGVGGLSITDSTLQATGGAGAAPAQQSGGYADIRLGTGQASENVAINNSTIKATGLEASVYVNSAGNITASNSTVTATAKTGADGGEGSVSFYATWSSGATIDTGSSTLTAVGRSSVDGGEGCCSNTRVSMQAGGNVTLGLLSSSDFISVYSNNGAIIDGNAGANASAPYVDFIASAGIGSIANPLETSTGNLYLSNGSGGEIGVINSGDLALAGLFNGGSGANAVGTTGTLVPYDSSINVSGDLMLTANNGMVIESIDITSGGNLVLSSGAGDMGFSNTFVSGNNVTLSGNNILVGFTTSTGPTVVSASNLMKVTTSGNLNVLGGADSEASALLAGADVDLTVGTTSGFLNIVSGSGGATAKISSDLPTTIHLTFPNLASGGYFVDGVENAVTNGNTGFFADGGPAVLGQNLIVTYGGLPPTPTPTSPTLPPDETDEPPPGIDDAINQVIAATNNQTELPDKEPAANTSPTGDIEEKKELPVCK